MRVYRRISSRAVRSALLLAILFLCGSTTPPAFAQRTPAAFNNRAGVGLSALATIHVTTTADVADGDTSSFNNLANHPGPDNAIALREALLAANAMPPGALTAGFAIPTSDPGYTSATGAWTIKLGLQALPALSHGDLTIEGPTQAGSPGRPKIVLDGFNVYEATELSNGITITSARNVVRGLTLMNFYDDAVLIDGPSAALNQIAGNYVGTSASGGAPEQPSYFGIEIRNGAHDNTIGGTSAASRNIISGNLNSGILLKGPNTKNNTIANNWIGADATGAAPLKNSFAGIMLNGGATNNTIGGAGQGNLISGNDTGIYIDGAIATLIAGNTIGLAADRSTPLGNRSGGIFIVNGGRDTQIGGASAALRNIISGNGEGASALGQGIYLANVDTSDNVILGNYIGVDVSGLLPAGNLRQGIMIGTGAQNNHIGGTAPGEGNVIAYNGLGGVRIDAPNNQVAGNLIGVGANGSTQLGNQSNGVRVGGDYNTIGPNNIIAYNQHAGILLLGSNTTVLNNTLQANGRSGICVGAPNTTIDGNLIERNGADSSPWPECPIRSGVVITATTGTLVTNNQIFSNSDTGITVYGGVSNRLLANSISDNQSAGIRLLRGGNEEMPPPQISSVQTDSVTGNSCSACRVEVFTDESDEGRDFVGATFADASGAFRMSITPSALRGPHLTATHTDSQGNTSSFAPAVVIPAPVEESPSPTPVVPTRPPALQNPIFLPIISG